MKTLKEIEEFNSTNTVTAITIGYEDYPHFFVNNEYIGWAEYIDFSNFNPFELLGFTETYINISIDSDYEERDKAQEEIDECFGKGDTIEEIKKLGLKPYFIVEVR